MSRFSNPISRSIASLVLIAAAGAGLAVSSSHAQPTSSGLPSSVLITKMPTDAKEVSAAVVSAQPGEKITLRGRIALAKDAFDQSKSVFTLTDDAAAAGCCPKDGSLMESCKLGGDRKATIQVIDAAGKPISGGLDGRSGLKHGAEVFVVGTVASTNGKDSLVVNASGLHVPAVSVPLGLFTGEAAADAKNVSDARKTGGFKKGDKIVLRGVIGGSKEPFVTSRTMFTLMGNALKPCNANPDDKCASPWDYCCDPKSAITANSATIRVVDAKGNPLKTDLKGRAGLKELSDVVVVGTVAMADKNSLIVDASSLHVAKP